MSDSYRNVRPALPPLHAVWPSLRLCLLQMPSSLCQGGSNRVCTCEWESPRPSTISRQYRSKSAWGCARLVRGSLPRALKILNSRIAVTVDQSIRFCQEAVVRVYQESIQLSGAYATRQTSRRRRTEEGSTGPDYIG